MRTHHSTCPFSCPGPPPAPRARRTARHFQISPPRKRLRRGGQNGLGDLRIRLHLFVEIQGRIDLAVFFEKIQFGRDLAEDVHARLDDGEKFLRIVFAVRLALFQKRRRQGRETLPRLISLRYSPESQRSFASSKMAGDLFSPEREKFTSSSLSVIFSVLVLGLQPRSAM